MVLGGLPVTICDTAGLREATGSIEKEGIRRAKMTAEQADLRIWMSCVGEAKPAENLRSGDLFVLNKVDMEPDLSLDEEQIGISVATGQGLEGLSERLEAQILTLFGETEAPVVTRERHRVELQSCKGALQSAVSLVERDGDVSLVAEELRRAVRAVGRITGRVDVEELLDVVFRDFCIGK